MVGYILFSIPTLKPHNMLHTWILYGSAGSSIAHFPSIPMCENSYFVQFTYVSAQHRRIGVILQFNLPNFAFISKLR